MAGKAAQSRRMLREAFWQFLLIAALLAVLFPGVWLQSEVIAPGDVLFQAQPWSHYAPAGWEQPQNRLMSDIVTFFLPQYALVNRALTEPHVPLWNPTQLGGVPLHANYQSAVFYPPRLLHYALGVRWGQTFYVLLKLALCGATAYGAARLLGLRIAAARFFSVAWMLSSYCIVWCNWPLTDVAAWLPVVFWGIESTVRRHTVRGFFGTALGGTLFLLAGHPETAFAMGLGLGVYFVLRLAMEGRGARNLWKALSTQAAAWGVVLLICGVVLLPFAEYLLHSATFFDRPGESRITHYPFSALVCFWMPRFFGTIAEDTWWGVGDSNVNGMLYMGWAVWVLACSSLGLAVVDKNLRRTAVPLLGGSLLGVLLAFRAPGFDAVNGLPVFSSMLKIYHTAFALFALPWLAALGADALLRRRWTPTACRGVFLCVALPATLLGAIYGVNAGLVERLGLRSYISKELALALVFVCLALVGLGWARRRPALGIALLSVVLAADLMTATRGLNPSMPADLVFPRTALTDYLSMLPDPTRVGAAEGNVASGILGFYGIEEWLGYDGLYPDRVVDFQTRLGPDVWKAMEPACAIAYYLHDPRFRPVFPLDEPGRFTKAAALDGIEVYRNNAALPRARLVAQLEHAANVDALFTRMRSPGFDPEAIAITDVPVHLEAADIPLRGRASLVHHDSADVRVRVECNRPAVLVLADAYYPGWRVWINGEERDVFPVYHMFRGVLVPQGSSVVVFRYDPLSFRWGARLSLLGILTAGLIGLAVVLRQRRLHMRHQGVVADAV